MSLTLRDIVANFMEDLKVLDCNPGPQIPAVLTLEEAQVLTRERLKVLRTFGARRLEEGRELEAWQVLAHCQKAVSMFNLLLDSLESQGRGQGMAS